MSVVLKKKFGQNFLIDKNIINNISNLIPSKNLNILEIGPGDGRLTDRIILKKPNKLTLVEIDKTLMSTLTEKFSKYKNIKIINSDILAFDFEKKYELIISNLPYNISSQILVKLSLLDNTPELLILMFQKEFALRVLDKKLNAINSLIKCFYDVKSNFNVSKNCFRPIPKVDSTVLTFKKIKKKLKDKEETEKFILFKRNLFSHKRKTLRSNLKDYKIENQFDLNLRVENLKLEELIKLFRATNF